MLKNEFIQKRISLGLVEDEALNEIILSSSGIVKFLIRFMQDACVRALANKKKKITLEEAREVASHERNYYRAHLTKLDYDILKEVEKTKEVGSEERYLHLLQIHALVEYNDKRWVYPNYLILPLLKEKNFVK